MHTARFVRELQRNHAQEIARYQEMVQSLLDRIQHPDRTPIWREAPDPPLEEVQYDGLQLVLDPDQMP